MGVGGHVSGEEHDKYEKKYALKTEKGVAGLLQDIHYLQTRAHEHGDMAAVDIIVDTEEAIERANLTDKQKRIISLVYTHDYEQTKAAESIGIEKSTLSRNKSAALKKITDIFREWNYT